MEDNKKPLAKPDEETLHTTDPQENMKGPLSSLMQGIKHEAEQGGKEDAEKIKQQEEQKETGKK
ncbi:hypothetical protein ACX0G7_18150 [Flavitalea antarctica]